MNTLLHPLKGYFSIGCRLRLVHVFSVYELSFTRTSFLPVTTLLILSKTGYICQKGACHPLRPPSSLPVTTLVDFICDRIYLSNKDACHPPRPPSSLPVTTLLILSKKEKKTNVNVNCISTGISHQSDI